MPVTDEIEIVSEQPKRKRGRPRKGEERPKAQLPVAAQDVSPFSGSGFEVRQRGVTPNWLADALGKDAKTIRSRIANAGLQPVREDGRYKFYDFEEAVSLFVAPGDAVARFLQNAMPWNLPPLLQDAYWKAQKSKMAVGIDSNQLFKAAPIEDLIRRMLFLAVETAKMQGEFTISKFGEAHRQEIEGIVDRAIEDLNRSYKAALEDFADEVTVTGDLIQEERKTLIRERAEKDAIDADFDEEGD